MWLVHIRYFITIIHTLHIINIVYRRTSPFFLVYKKQDYYPDDKIDDCGCYSNAVRLEQVRHYAERQ